MHHLLFCERCQAGFKLPLLMAEQTKQEIALLVRAGAVMQAIEKLRQHSDLALLDCKAPITHHTKTPHTCHHCANNSLASGNSLCPTCNAFNLNW